MNMKKIALFYILYINTFSIQVRVRLKGERTSSETFFYLHFWQLCIERLLYRIERENVFVLVFFCQANINGPNLKTERFCRPTSNRYFS